MTQNDLEDSLTNCTSRKDGLALLQNIADKFSKEEIHVNINWGQALMNKDWYLSLHHARFLNNIVLCYIKKGMIEDGKKLLELTSGLIDDLVNLEVKQDTDFMYHFYSIFWNTSLKLTNPASWHLQKYALKWLALSGQLTKCFDLASKVCYLCEAKQIEVTLLEDFVATILRSSASYVKVLQKPVEPDLIPKLYNLLAIYAKYLLALNKCKQFSKTHESISQGLEKHCSSDIMLTLKLALKLTGYVMALATQKCTKERFMEALQMSSHAKNSDESNIVICDFYNFLLSKSFREYPAVEQNFSDILVCLLKLLSQRFLSGKIPDSVSTGELVSKHLSSIVRDVQANQETKKSRLDSLTKLAELFHTFCGLLDETKAQTQIFNIGVELCNLGVLSYMSECYDNSVKYLDVGLRYLVVQSENEVGDVREKTRELIAKKAGVLKDGHRYAGNMMKAMEVVFKFFNEGLFCINDVISTWIKCKRDSPKFENDPLKGFCFKNVYETLGMTGIKSSKLNVYDLIIMEIKQMSGTNVPITDQISSATNLCSSPNIVHQIKANLALCRLHWCQPEEDKKDAPISFLIKAHKLLLKYKKSSSFNRYLWTELQGLASLWAYLCVYQVLQTHNKESMENTDVTDSEAIETRVSTEKSSFAVQQAILKNLFESLGMWKELAKTDEFDDLEGACSAVLAIGRIFMLVPLETHSLQAFLTLLQMTEDKPDMKGYWMESLTQLVWSYPQYMPEKKVEQLKQSAEDNLKSKLVSEARCLASLCTVSYWYFHNGKITEGARLIKDCLQNPYLGKKTISSTEVCIRALLVYSHFCVCSSETLAEIGWEREHGNVPALSAARKASGVLIACAQAPTSETVDETFRLTWLYLTSVTWLSKLSYETAQPRVPRSYLVQTLLLTEEFVLPIRTAEFISTASRFEVLCEKFEENVTRIDSFSSLLKSHNEPVEKALKNHCNRHFLRVLKKLDDIPSVTEEEYSLSPVSVEGLVIGDPSRISYLAEGGSGSPSILTKKSMIKECTCADNNCYVCSSSVLGEAVVDACVMMAVMYALQSDKTSSDIYLKQAKDKLERMYAHQEEIQMKNVEDLSRAHILSQKSKNLNQTRCIEIRVMFHETEILCMMGDFAAAQQMNHNAIKLFIKIPSMAPSETLYIPKLLVQAKLIENALSLRESIPQAAEVGEEEVSNSPKEAYRTPPRSEMVAPTNRIRMPRKDFIKTFEKVSTPANLTDKLQELNLGKTSKPLRTPRQKPKETEKAPLSVKAKENKVRTRRNQRLDSSPTEQPKTEAGFGRSRRNLRRL